MFYWHVAELVEPSFATVCGSPKIDYWPYYRYTYYRYTTNRLILGMDVNFLAHLMFPHPVTKPTDVEDYVTRFTGSIQKAHDFARNTLKTSLRRMKRDTRKTYDEGGLVCLLCAAGVKRQMYKTTPLWKRPDVITRRISVSL